MAQLGYAQVKSLSIQLTHADGPVRICTSDVIIYSTHACRWPSWDMHQWNHYLFNSSMQMAQLGYAWVKSLSTQLTHADGPVGICAIEVIIYSTHACRWPCWDMHNWNHYLLNSRTHQMAQLGYAKVKSLSTQLTHPVGSVGICMSEIIIYSTHACIWRSCDMNKWNDYLLNSRMQMAQLGYAQEKSLSTQLTHADGPVGICTSEDIIYSTHECRWPSWDMNKWSQYILNSRMQMAQLGYAQVKSLSIQFTHADGPVGICTSDVIIYSTHACRWPSWDMHQWNHYIFNSSMQMAQLGYAWAKSLSTQLTHADGPVGICASEVIIYSTHARRWPCWDMHNWNHYLLNSRTHQMAQLGYAQVKSLSTQLMHPDGSVGICMSEIIIYSTHACRWPSWDMHKWSHYLLNSRIQMAQLGYAWVKSLSTQLTHAGGPVGICTSEVIIYSTHGCRYPSWDMHKWNHYLLNSRMQMAQLGYAQLKSLSTQLTHADGPVGICTSEIIIYSTHACRWPSWDMHKWSHYLLNSRIQMAQLGYAQLKSLSTQLTHADGPVGICTSEVIIYSTHASRWLSWDMHEWNHYLLNSRMQVAQLRYAQVKSLSTQLTDADGPVGICTSEVIIYSTHASRWLSWDMHEWNHYLLNSRMQVAQLGYAQVKSLSTQLTDADGPVGICISEIIIYSTHACRWPSWDMHQWNHYLFNSSMQMAQLGYALVKSLSTQLTHADGPVGICTTAQLKSISTQLTHADGPVGICTSEVIIYSTHASRWLSWDMHEWNHYLLNSRMQVAQLGYAQVKSLSTQLTDADGPVGICISEIIIYSTHACRWPSWDMHQWNHYRFNSSMQMAQLGYAWVKSLSTQLTHADGPVGICTTEIIIYSTHACRWPSWDMHEWNHYLLNSRMQVAQLGYAQVKSLSTQLTDADGPVGICINEIIIYSTQACRWPSWDMYEWNHYLLNSRMQMAQLGYAQVKSLSTQLTHADGPVGICTTEIIIYSTHACRWPSWDMHKWSHYLLNSRIQMAQLGYAWVKSLSTQLTHAGGPVGICTSEVIVYSTHGCRWPSWDMHKWNHYLLNSRMQVAQLGYAQVKSLSTQLTHAHGPVGICTGEVIIYSTHACWWPSWDMHKWSHYLLNSHMQMAQLGYAQVKSLSTQLTHANGPVGICISEVIIYSTHACRWPSWDMHNWNHYLLKSRMQMAQLGYAQMKSLSTQLTHADGPVGICTSEIIIYSTHACWWPSWDMHKWRHYLLNSRMQMAQLGYAPVKSLSIQLKHADGPVTICTSEVIIYSTHACRWPSWDMHKWSHYLLNSRMQMAQLGYA